MPMTADSGGIVMVSNKIQAGILEDLRIELAETYTECGFDRLIGIEEIIECTRIFAGAYCGLVKCDDGKVHRFRIERISDTYGQEMDIIADVSPEPVEDTSAIEN